MTTETITAAEPPVWGVKTVPLLFPLDGPNGKITEITLREPDAEQIEEIEEISLKEKRQTVVLRHTFAILSGVPADALKRLNARDYTAIAEAAGPLLEVMGKTGAT